MFLRELIFEKREYSNDTFERCNEKIEIDVPIEYTDVVNEAKENISLDNEEPFSTCEKKPEITRNKKSTGKDEKKKNKNTKRKNKKTNHKSDKPTMESV